MKNRYNDNEMTAQEEADVTSFFWNDKITDDKIQRMNILRQEGSKLCEFIIGVCPNSADRSAAIRYLRLAIMQGNASITNEVAKQGI